MAHENDACRTLDVRIDENVEFSSLMLSSRVLNGLQKNGFKRPSPVQLKAIPFGKCGVGESFSLFNFRPKAFIKLYQIV